MKVNEIWKHSLLKGKCLYTFLKWKKNIRNWVSWHWKAFLLLPFSCFWPKICSSTFFTFFSNLNFEININISHNQTLAGQGGGERGSHIFRKFSLSTRKLHWHPQTSSTDGFNYGTLYWARCTAFLVPLVCALEFTTWTFKIENLRVLFSIYFVLFSLKTHALRH